MPKENPVVAFLNKMADLILLNLIRFLINLICSCTSDWSIEYTSPILHAL